MTNVERVSARPVAGSAIGASLPARTRRAVANIEHRTIVRTATVQSEGMVATEKVHEINHVAREGVTDYAMLYHYATAASGGDPMLLDELRLYKETARLGGAEIVAELVDTYCREARR